MHLRKKPSKLLLVTLLERRYKKIYTLTIAYNDETEEIEYICEEIEDDEPTVVVERGTIDVDDYFDEEGLELISGCYIVGEA